MMLLIVGLIIFLGIHLLPTNTEIRDGLVTRLGANGYKAFFSLLSFAGLAVIILGYHKMQLHPGKNPVLFDPPFWLRHVSMLLMLPAMILFVASSVPSRIRTAVKHPLLMGTKLWALAHLLANGDVASLLLFGSFLGYAVYDLVSVKQRGALGPLGAKTPTSPINDVIVVAVGAALYFVLLYGGHAWLIGVDPLAGVAA